jgi:hypothetical protein
MKKIFYLLIGIFILALISFFLSGSKTNPPVKNKVEWDSQSTREQFYLSCSDCHSNETRWPWYSNFAPVSWLIINDVKEARAHFNISTKEQGHGYESTEMVESEVMPLDEYLFMHPEARMDSEEKEYFIVGLRKTFGQEFQNTKADSAETGQEHNHVH